MKKISKQNLIDSTELKSSKKKFTKDLEKATKVL